MLKKDISGEIFGRLKVIKSVGKDKWGHYLWLCKCECGNEVVVNGKSLRIGHSQSCGCLRNEKSSQRTTQRNKTYIGENNPMYGVRRYGTNNPNYNPNKTDEERLYCRLLEGMTPFKKGVYERDNYTCQCCGDSKGHNLVAHHLDGYNWCREKRTDVNNGITLCDKCHKEFHHIYGYKDNTKIQFDEFLNKKCAIK